jgi:hypothetical protein
MWLESGLRGIRSAAESDFFAATACSRSRFRRSRPSGGRVRSRCRHRGARAGKGAWLRVPAAGFARVLLLFIAQWRPKGAGKAGRRRHPLVRARQECTRGGPMGGRSPGLPCADGFNGVLRALPGERCTIAPVALRMTDARARSGRHITAGLDAQTPGVRTTRLLRPRTVPPDRQGLACAHPGQSTSPLSSAVSYRVA